MVRLHAEMLTCHMTAPHEQAASSLTCSSAEGVKPCGRFIMAKRMAFHSLLHQCLYATTRLMSRLMSRPWLVYDTSAKRSASVPHSSMPSGKSACWPDLARSASLGSRLPGGGEGGGAGQHVLGQVGIW
jgi:hypothetical protein